jgi:hypothetical protein
VNAAIAKEMELSMTRWTSSLGIKWANDHTDALRELHRTAKFVSNAEQNAPRSQRLVNVSRGTYLVRQAGVNPCCEGAIRGMIDMECGDDCVEAVCG